MSSTPNLSVRGAQKSPDHHPAPHSCCFDSCQSSSFQETDMVYGFSEQKSGSGGLQCPAGLRGDHPSGHLVGAASCNYFAFVRNPRCRAQLLRPGQGSFVGAQRIPEQSRIPGKGIALPSPGTEVTFSAACLALTPQVRALADPWNSHYHSGLSGQCLSVRVKRTLDLKSHPSPVLLPWRWRAIMFEA